MTSEAVSTPQAGRQARVLATLGSRPGRQPADAGVSPERIALTLAVGSALALLPILGTTTTLCLIAGIVLGLNQPIIQAVNALCIIVCFPLIPAFVRLGDAL